MFYPGYRVFCKAEGETLVNDLSKGNNKPSRHIGAREYEPARNAQEFSESRPVT